MSAARAFFFRSTAAALALGAGVAAAQAQGYPAKPITLIVPFTAGGGVDATARLLTAKLGEQLKQPVVIENVAGAAGTIGTQKAARAPADGYTLLFAVASPLNVAPLVAPSAVRYDSFKDFVPVATVGTSPFVLIGKTALPAAHHGRADPAGEGAARQAQLRHRRGGHLAAHHGRDVQAARRHRPDARALQVGPAGADRCGGRPGRPRGAAAVAGAALREGRQGRGLRRHLGGPFAQCAGDSRTGRDARAQGTGNGCLARRAGPRRHAGRGDRGLGQRARRHAQGPGDRTQARRHRRQAAADRRPAPSPTTWRRSARPSPAWCRPPASRSSKEDGPCPC